jgi:O-antigen ligase
MILAALASVGALLLEALTYSPAAAFLPAVLLGLLLLGLRWMRRPADVVAVYLVLVVNLDVLKLPGSGISADVIVSALLTWALLIRMVLSGQPLLRGALSRTYALFLAVALISVFLSVAPLDSVKRWGRDFEYLVLLAFLLAEPMGEGERRRIVGAVILSALLPCLVGLLTLFVDTTGILRRHYLDPALQHMRVSAHLSHPVTLALFLLVTGTLTLSHILSRRRFSPAWLTAGLGLQFLVLVLTFGRSGWIGFLLAALALLWLRGHRWLLWVVAPLAVAGLVIAVPVFQERMASAMEVSRENSLLWRLGLWAHALSLFPQRPLFGSGPGTFLDYVAYSEGFGPHQAWLGLLIETGIVGLAAFVGVMAVVGRSLWAQRRRAGADADPVLDAALAVWVGLLFASLTANAFGLPAVGVYFWTLVGLALQPAGPTPSPRAAPAGAA